MPLTAIEVQRAKAAGTPKRLFDGGGLYLEVSPSGGKLWRLKYRFDGKEKRLAVGIYPAVSIAAARKRRDAARELLAHEIDPGVHRKVQKAAKAERAESSFEVVAREWFAKHLPTWASSQSAAAQHRLRQLSVTGKNRDRH